MIPGWFVAAVALDEGSDFSDVPEDCLAWTESTTGAISCTEFAGDGMSPDFGDPGIPGWFVAAFFLVIVMGIGTTIWRVSTARRMARGAGMDVSDATAMTLLDEDGLSATYLAASLRGPSPDGGASAGQPVSAYEATARLRELEKLYADGVIERAEYATRRQAIIDSV